MDDEFRWRVITFNKYLWWDNIISHVPKSGVHVRGVGIGKAFHFGGDTTEDRVCLLVGLLHHTHIPAGLQQYAIKSLQYFITTLALYPHFTSTVSTACSQVKVCWYLPHHIQQHQKLGEPEDTS